MQQTNAEFALQPAEQGRALVDDLETFLPSLPPSAGAPHAKSFCIGSAEFVIMGLLLQVATDLHVRAVSPILLLFGGGMIVGNILGGRFADRQPTAALLGSLSALIAVLAAMTFAVHSQPAMAGFVGILGVAAFATVSPLQLRVLHHASGAGQNLASSFNIAAFNLGNGIGAWLGGMVVAHGPGLNALPWVAALAPLAALLVAGFSVRRERGNDRMAVVAELG